MRLLRILAAAALVAVAGIAQALDAPHDASLTSTGSCDSCHKLHSSSGGTLLGGGYASNNDACIGCHNIGVDPGNQLGLPWSVTDQASPGAGGQHHSWSGAAYQPAFGATAPANTEMVDRIVSGNMQCATCHDPHADDRAFAPTSFHSSIGIGVNTNNSAGSGGGQMRVDSIAIGANTAGYRIRISGAGQFQISHDYGTGLPTWNGPFSYTVGVATTLDDPAVKVVFTGLPAVGDEWAFYVAYPRLRQTNVDDAMCVQCHADRVQSHTVVGAETTDGSRVMSHPVGAGVTMGVNGGGYDLTPATVLDATGVTQTAGDGNKTNDFVFGSLDTVRCTTCHAPHNADSNSLTVDLR
jgi:predicted CXXCH cytochrome family protein